MARLSIKEVAEITGHSEQTIRVGLQQGVFDFGVAVQRPNSNRYTYVIYPEIINKLYGRNNKNG